MAFGDPMVGTPDRVAAPDALSFAGIQPPWIPVYPLGTHLAEKVHAYTLPRDGENGRMKDLIDIALVASESALQPESMAIAATTLRDALEATFAFRATHPVPAACPPPPASWAARYPRDRELNGLPWPRIEDAHAEVARSSIRCSRRQHPVYGCRPRLSGCRGGPSSSSSNFAVSSEQAGDRRRRSERSPLTLWFADED